VKELTVLTLLFLALALSVSSQPLQAAAPERQTLSVGDWAPPQQAEPAGSADEDQATVNWMGVLIPLIVVLVIIFAVGLFLMRIWHWIDPT
jgi:disulfide bond formation protein DsbB